MKRGRTTRKRSDSKAAPAARRPAQASVSRYIGLAETLSRQGKPDDAERAYRQALTISPDETVAWSGLGRVRYGMGNVRGAIQAWEQVIARGADSWETHSDVGAAWMELREWDRAEACFARASASQAVPPIVVVNRATLDAQRGRRGHAIASLQRCVAEHSSYAPAWAGLGFMLRDEGRFDEAAAALERAMKLAPGDATYACGVGRVYLEAGDPVRASARAQAYLRVRPGHSGALALESLSRLALGETRAVATLLDYANLVSFARLPTPAGFSDIAAFNSALAAHAVAHPSLVSAPASHATAAGLHSGSLLCEPRGPVAFLERAVGAAIVEYGRRLSISAEHPFMASRPRSVFLKMWCVILQRGGHQIPHIHPAAWLSGVYYPQVPAAIRDQPGRAGGLEFGQPDRAFPSALSPPLLFVRPEEGLLVLFPSYFYHRTVPFDEPGTRISVAFDVVPLERLHTA